VFGLTQGFVLTLKPFLVLSQQAQTTDFIDDFEKKARQIDLWAP